MPLAASHRRACFLNVPFALIGGVAALAWAGMPLSVSAAVGFIALIARLSLNGVLVLSAVLEQRRADARSIRRSRWAVANGCGRC
jgi:Cu/Ag efflux pump CusA